MNDHLLWIFLAFVSELEQIMTGVSVGIGASEVVYENH